MVKIKTSKRYTRKYKNSTRRCRKNKRCKKISKRRRYICRNCTRRRKYKMAGGEKIPKEEIEAFSTLYGDERMNKLLSKICGPETKGSCLDFTKYKQYINSYFENYSLESPYVTALRRIGSASANGAVLEFQYNRNNYISHSALKFNRRNMADNLLYEYYVGSKFINDYISIFPCFIETYKQLYMIDDVSKFETLLNVPNHYVAINDDIKKCLREIKNPDYLINSLSKMINNACMYGKKNAISIMLQHFSNFTSLSDAIKSSSVDIDFPNLMMQVYFPLAIMKDIYTHYDLHRKNVYLFKPYTGNRYIEFTYHYNDGTSITFPCEYIVKIIDYGRNFFNNKRLGISSKDIIENVCLKCDDEKCENPACYSSEIVQAQQYGTTFNILKANYCGENSGMYVGEYNKPPGTMNYISPNIKNVSHDLRLLYGNLQLDNGMIVDVFDYLSVIDPGMHLSYEAPYGTKEKINSTYETTGSIRNVEDLFKALKQNLNTFINANFSEWKNKTNGKYGSSWIKMGELHIYEDMREYQFIESTKVDSNDIPTQSYSTPQVVPVPFLQDVNLSNSSPIAPIIASASSSATSPSPMPAIISSQNNSNQGAPVDFLNQIPSGLSSWSSSSGVPLNRQNEALQQQSPPNYNYNLDDSDANSGLVGLM